MPSKLPSDPQHAPGVCPPHHPVPQCPAPDHPSPHCPAFPSKFTHLLPNKAAHSSPSSTLPANELTPGTHRGARREERRRGKGRQGLASSTCLLYAPAGLPSHWRSTSLLPPHRCSLLLALVNPLQLSAELAPQLSFLTVSPFHSLVLTSLLRYN